MATSAMTTSTATGTRIFHSFVGTATSAAATPPDEGATTNPGLETGRGVTGWALESVTTGIAPELMVPARPLDVSRCRLQIGPQVGGVLIAQVAVLLQGLIDNSFQLGRQIWVGELAGLERGSG